MTRGEIKTLMASWLDDINKTYFTDAQMNVWINLAQRQVQLHLLNAGENFYMKPVESTLVANQADYVLPNDFIVEHRIEVILSGTGVNENRQPLLPITTNQQDLVPISNGNPSHYYIKKDRITVSPTPNQALTMRLYYSPRVADLSADADTPDVPEHFMEYVAMVACFNGFIKDDRAPDNLLVKKKEYEEILRQMSEDRTQDLPRQVVVLDDDSIYGAWF